MASSNTNQIGMEMLRPDVLPLTVMVISLDRERRSLRASFLAGMSTSGSLLLGAKLLPHHESCFQVLEKSSFSIMMAVMALGQPA